MDPDKAKRFGGDTMAIPAPIEVDEIMRKVPFGQTITIADIRAAVAEKHHADVACPFTCGIFAWISAHAAEEAKEGGDMDITPFWRTLKSDGSLNPKYPGGIEQQRELLEAEGHKVLEKGKRWVVAK